MRSSFVFSWAENAEGRMVHVDDVPRGLKCGCTCPYCHERLLARHGEVNEHGFAHHSDTRGANLEICYMVILYKLAEQIVQTKKRIHAPSYYGIFRGGNIEFVDVKVDGCFEREDKQPDVIATTSDGKRYLIEFTFDYKVQHRQAIDYKNMNCLEIDLSNQSLESVESFLLETGSDRKWLNNQHYFESIESRYQQSNKTISVKEESECRTCELQSECIGVREKGKSELLTIYNNGNTYRLCKPELYEKKIKEYHQLKVEEEERRRLDEECRRQFMERVRLFKMKKAQERQLMERQATVNTEMQQEQIVKTDKEEKQADFNVRSLRSNEPSCFMCASNLSWQNRDGYASCGCYISLKIPKKTPPEFAATCKRFKRKS